MFFGNQTYGKAYGSVEWMDYWELEGEDEVAAAVGTLRLFNYRGLFLDFFGNGLRLKNQSAKYIEKRFPLVSRFYLYFG